MKNKKALCVGLYDNEYSLILKLLLIKKGIFTSVLSVGIDRHAHNELDSSQAVKNIALDLGFVLVQHTPAHHNTIKEAKKNGHIVFHHQPTYISEVADIIDTFDAIFTPYRSVHDQLIEKYGADPTKISIICSPAGIKTGTSLTVTYPQIHMEVQQNV